MLSCRNELRRLLLANVSKTNGYWHWLASYVDRFTHTHTHTRLCCVLLCVYIYIYIYRLSREVLVHMIPKVQLHWQSQPMTTTTTTTTINQAKTAQLDDVNVANKTTATTMSMTMLDLCYCRHWYRVRWRLKAANCWHCFALRCTHLRRLS
jgi:hypothetical protein